MEVDFLEPVREQHRRGKPHDKHRARCVWRRVRGWRRYSYPLRDCKDDTSVEAFL